MFIKKNRGQSILEYTILLGVVVAGLLVMQVFIKRGFQGGLKDSADKFGDQFSASNSASLTKKTLTDDQVINEEVSTDNTISNFTNLEVKGTLDKGVYSYSDRSGGIHKVDTQETTDDLKQEATRWSDHPDKTFDDISENDVVFN